MYVPEASSDSPFPITRWSLVARAGSLADPIARGALNQLIRSYLIPLRAHLIQYRNVPPEQADDLLHDFVIDKLLERNILSLADPVRGKFRSFLLTTLDRFIIDAQRRDGALRRKPAQSGIPGDVSDYAETLPDPRLSPPMAFDLLWAQQVLSDVATQMQSECRSSSRVELWGLFEQRVLKPATEGIRPRAMPELVREYNLSSAEHASNQLSTAKRMFARIFRSVIREYTADEAELESEVRDLWQIISSPRQIAPSNP